MEKFIDISRLVLSVLLVAVMVGVNTNWIAAIKISVSVSILVVNLLIVYHGFCNRKMKSRE